jgi:hypothetical protein
VNIIPAAAAAVDDGTGSFAIFVVPCRLVLIAAIWMQEKTVFLDEREITITSTRNKISETPKEQDTLVYSLIC